MTKFLRKKTLTSVTPKLKKILILTQYHKKHFFHIENKKKLTEKIPLYVTHFLQKQMESRSPAHLIDLN